MKCARWNSAPAAHPQHPLQQINAAQAAQAAQAASANTANTAANAANAANVANDAEIYPWMSSKARSNIITCNIIRCLKVKRENIVPMQTTTRNDSNLYLIRTDVPLPNLGNGVSKLSIDVHEYTVVQSVGPSEFLVDSLNFANIVGASADAAAQVPATITNMYDYNKTGGNPTELNRDTVETKGLHADPTRNRENSTGYTAALLPECTDDLYKFKIKSTMYGAKLCLVTAKSENPVTYDMVANLLNLPVQSGKKSTDNVEYNVISNTDSQNHTHKGLFGVRIDQGNDCYVKNLHCEEYESGTQFPAVNLTSSSSILKKSGAGVESKVGDMRFVSLNGVKNVVVENVVVDDAVTLGRLYGVECRGGSDNVVIKGVSLEGTEAGNVYGNADLFEGGIGGLDLENEGNYPTGTFEPAIPFPEMAAVKVSADSTNVVQC